MMIGDQLSPMFRFHNGAIHDACSPIFNDKLFKKNNDLINESKLNSTLNISNISNASNNSSYNPFGSSFNLNSSNLHIGSNFKKPMPVVIQKNDGSVPNSKGMERREEKTRVVRKGSVPPLKPERPKFLKAMLDAIRSKSVSSIKEPSFTAKLLYVIKNGIDEQPKKEEQKSNPQIPEKKFEMPSFINNLMFSKPHSFESNNVDMLADHANMESVKRNLFPNEEEGFNSPVANVSMPPDIANAPKRSQPQAIVDFFKPAQPSNDIDAPPAETPKEIESEVDEEDIAELSRLTKFKEDVVDKSYQRRFKTFCSPGQQLRNGKQICPPETKKLVEKINESEKEVIELIDAKIKSLEEKMLGKKKKR